MKKLYVVAFCLSFLGLLALAMHKIVPPQPELTEVKSFDPNKVNMLFDITQIVRGYASGGVGGMYNVELNLLRQFKQDSRFNIICYCPTKFYSYGIDFLKRNYDQPIELIVDNCLVTKVSYWYRRSRLMRQQRRWLARLACQIVSLCFEYYGKFLGMFTHQYEKLPMLDIAFSTFEILPDWVKRKQTYMVIHDTVPLMGGSCGLKWRRYFRGLLPEYNYFAISQATKKDFMKYLNLPEERISVTLLAAGEEFYQEKNDERIVAMRQKYKIPQNMHYFFTIGRADLRKNLNQMIKAFIEFIHKYKVEDLIFVIAGQKPEPKVMPVLKELSPEDRSKLFYINFVDVEDLRVLYSGAMSFIFTSGYEGFGLPALEALQCGCPVITANNSSLPEVVGDAAITIDCGSGEQHMAAYADVYFHPEIREELSARGLARAQQFSWKKTADLMIDKMLADIGR